MKKFEVTEELITPEKAYDYLKSNTKNRNLSKKLVSDYADQMKAGKWKLTSQTLTFDKDNILIDGQHRLAAVVKSKEPQSFLVARGSNREDIYKVYDTGKKRSAGDVLSIEGVSNSRKVAAIIKSKKKLDDGFLNLSGHATLTNQDVHEVYKSNSELYHEIISFSRKCVDKLSLFPAGYLGGIIAHLVMTKGHDIRDVFSFFESLHFRTAFECSSVDVLREKLINSMLKKMEFPQPIKLGLIKKAWNAYVDGKNPKMLRVSYDETKDLYFK